MNDDVLAGKVAVVTGSTSGARTFVAAGADVILLARGRERLIAGRPQAFGRVLAQEVRDLYIRVTMVVQGTEDGGGNDSTDWAWDPDHGAAALELWRERGLLAQVYGRHGGQSVSAIGEVHLFVVTRPRTQMLDTVHCRSF